MKKRLLTAAVMTAAFFLQLKRGLAPNVQPYVVVFSAALSACLAWAVLRLAFTVFDKIKK